MYCILLLVLGLFRIGLGLTTFSCEAKTKRPFSLSTSSGGGDGKFIRMETNSALTLSPPCLIVCNTGNKLSEYHLETIDDILFALVGRPLPVLIAGRNDATVSLRQLLLTPSNVETRDHAIPSQYLLSQGPPAILFSGLERSTISAAISGIKSWSPPNAQSPTTSPFPPIAFAMVVSAALEKPLLQLFGEIQGDYAENIKESQNIKSRR